MAFGPDTASAARSAVTVVPMFAPIVIGNACSSRNNPAAPSGTSNDVVIELDCTMTVTATPTSMESTALDPSTSVTSSSTRVRTSDRMTFTSRNSETKMRPPAKAISATPWACATGNSLAASCSTGSSVADKALANGLS